MSDKPPPFADYISVSGDELWAKILSGEIEAHIYSSEAPGDFEPVPISAAAFFVAEEAGRDEDGAPDPRLKSYQIMVRDRDQRRLSGTRRHIPVPHWVYVARKESSAPKAPKQQPKSRTQARRDRVRMAAKALWPPSGNVPDQAVLSNASMCKMLGEWLKADCRARGIAADVPSDDTMLRAVGRK
jgi:hypothetical protein